jgi:hypothetical protein
MRYSKMHTALNDASLMASLDLEVAHVPGCHITIESIDVDLENGWVQPLSDYTFGSAVHKPGDQITYLYKIRPDLMSERRSIHGHDGHVLSLKITAKMLVSNGSSPKLDIHWKTPVDFTPDNPSLVKAAHRLSNPGFQQIKGYNPDALPQDVHSQQGDAPLINVILTISGPPRVQAGDIFYWEVFIVNRSDKTRKLAVLVLPKRKRDLEKHMARPSTSSAGGYQGENKDIIASSVVDENIVYAKQKNARTEAAELICLTTDVRIG